MSEKGLMDWFGKRKEETVSTGARSHGVAVLDTVSELELVLASMAKGEKETALKGVDRLMLSEREADRIEDRLAADISRGDLTVGERGDLLHFIRQIDSIANWAKEAALHVQLILETDAVVPKEIWEEMAATVNELIEEVKFLVSAIETYNSDIKRTLRTIDSINDQERIVDSKYYSSIKHAHMSDMDAKAILLVTEVINAIEMAADNGKASGDTINILITSRGLQQ